ncbi:hypothetical protein NCS56_01433400 [Fusarium sp. Ph1]|nr:hypothetical protein NCS56_01433400 [Fusarium sp. Ph1]
MTTPSSSRQDLFEQASYQTIAGALAKAKLTEADFGHLRRIRAFLLQNPTFKYRRRTLAEPAVLEDLTELSHWKTDESNTFYRDAAPIAESPPYHWNATDPYPVGAAWEKAKKIIKKARNEGALPLDDELSVYASSVDTTIELPEPTAELSNPTPSQERGKSRESAIPSALGKRKTLNRPALSDPVQSYGPDTPNAEFLTAKDTSALRSSPNPTLGRQNQTNIHQSHNQQGLQPNPDSTLSDAVSTMNQPHPDQGGHTAQFQSGVMDQTGTGSQGSHSTVRRTLIPDEMRREIDACRRSPTARRMLELIEQSYGLKLESAEPTGPQADPAAAQHHPAFPQPAQDLPPRPWMPGPPQRAQYSAPPRSIPPWSNNQGQQQGWNGPYPQVPYPTFQTTQPPEPQYAPYAAMAPTPPYQEPSQGRHQPQQPAQNGWPQVAEPPRERLASSALGPIPTGMTHTGWGWQGSGRNGNTGFKLTDIGLFWPDAPSKGKSEYPPAEIFYDKTTAIFTDAHLWVDSVRSHMEGSSPQQVMFVRENAWRLVRGSALVWWRRLLDDRERQSYIASIDAFLDAVKTEFGMELQEALEWLDQAYFNLEDIESDRPLRDFSARVFDVSRVVGRATDLELLTRFYAKLHPELRQLCRPPDGTDERSKYVSMVDGKRKTLREKLKTSRSGKGETGGKKSRSNGKHAYITEERKEEESDQEDSALWGNDRPWNRGHRDRNRLPRSWRPREIGDNTYDDRLRPQRPDNSNRQQRTWNRQSDWARRNDRESSKEHWDESPEAKSEWWKETPPWERRGQDQGGPSRRDPNPSYQRSQSIGRDGRYRSRENRNRDRPERVYHVEDDSQSEGGPDESDESAAYYAEITSNNEETYLATEQGRRSRVNFALDNGQIIEAIGRPDFSNQLEERALTHLRIPLTFEGTKDAKIQQVCCDSGALATVVDKRWLAEHGKKVVWKDQEPKTLSGIGKVTSITKSATFDFYLPGTVRGTEVKAHFTVTADVVDQLTPNLLLGTGFLYEHGAKVDFVNLSVSFRSAHGITIRGEIFRKRVSPFTRAVKSAYAVTIKKGETAFIPVTYKNLPETHGSEGENEAFHFQGKDRRFFDSTIDKSTPKMVIFHNPGTKDIQIHRRQLIGHIRNYEGNETANLITSPSGSVDFHDSA